MWDEEYDMEIEDEEAAVSSAGKILGILLTVFSLLGYVLVHANWHSTNDADIGHIAKTVDELSKDVKELNVYLRDNPR